MLPIVFEWKWTIDYFIFMGLLYFVLTLIGLGLLTAFLMTLKSLQDGPHDEGHGHGHGNEPEPAAGH